MAKRGIGNSIIQHKEEIMPQGTHRKHTPIVSEKQRGLFGAELARRRAGKARRMPDITTRELEEHLRESKGKQLPKRVKRK